MAFKWDDRPGGGSPYMRAMIRKRMTDPDSPTGAVADACVSYSPGGRFRTAGTVDAQIVTRIQYDIPVYAPNSPSSGYQFSGQAGASQLYIGGGFAFSAADYALYPGEALSITAFLAHPDSIEAAYGVGHVPTPEEIYACPGTSSFRLIDSWTDVPAGDPPSGDNYYGFGMPIPWSFLEANKKYWLLIAPTHFEPGAVTGVLTDIPHPPLNTNGRAISFWTNRPPVAPVITSPEQGTVVSPGTNVLFKFTAKGSDAFNNAPGDQSPWAFSDLAGVQVQYAAKPHADNPDPEWNDLPIATLQHPPEEGRGWFIDNAAEVVAGSPPFRRGLDGAEILRNTKQMMIQCAGADLIGGYGVLGEGEWQIRIRTFDYGHPLAIVPFTGPFTGTVYPQYAFPGFGPLGSFIDGESPITAGSGTFADNDYDPDTFPETNTSPWSEPVHLTVSTQVPPVIPISPTDNIAVQEGEETILRWQYRNSHVPPFVQRERQVQIRKVGEVDWTTLASGVQSDDFYNVGDPAPNGTLPGEPDPPPPPVQYVTDGGFESGITGWSYSSTTAGISWSSADSHSGTHSLKLNDVTTTGSFSPVVYQFFDVDPAHRYCSLSVWLKKGATTDAQFVQIAFVNDAHTQLGSASKQADAGSGWKQVQITDKLIPPGTTQMLVSITSTDNGHVYSGDYYDDISILASPTFPVEPVEVTPPGHLLPDSDPIEYTLEATTHYEWRVRVSDAGLIVSDWSDIARFWVVPPIVEGGPGPVPTSVIQGATLGCGKHRVEVFRRGGTERVGELTGLSYLDWGRLRDDISDAKVIVSGWDFDCGNLLSQLQTWAYELVITRDNGYSVERVWEGPIIRLTYERDAVTIHAKDVMAYAYRRIIKQTMNDSSSGAAQGRKGDTVTSRAARVLHNVFAPDDPNILAYLTVFSHATDTKEFRNLPPYSRTAYEEVDDMASNNGLDYTVSGRSILLWGTKRRIGTLPEFRDEDLGNSPIVSEYGMSMANVYVVSDGNGTYGEADRLDEFKDDDTYGLVEMLSSTWASESESETGTYTEEGLATVRASFAEYAERSISSRYPPPVVVRIPDNTTLNPGTVLSIQQLIPGVAIPLRSTGTLRSVVDTQKLDSIKVTEIAGKETITVTLSPFNREDTSGEEGGEE